MKIPKASFPVWVLCAALFLVVTNARPASTPELLIKSRAACVRLSLAGSRLSPLPQNSLKYDRKEKYYLNFNKDGLGRLMSIKLVLSPDPKRLGDPFAEGVTAKHITHTTLPRLRNGTGVNIGDTPHQVRRKLGSAPTLSQYNSRTKERTYTWQAPVSVKADGRWQSWRYSGIYTFRNERLWAITYWVYDESEAQ